jgi:hypothetical protein
MGMTLEKEMLTKLSKSMADQIDWNILSEILIEQGWKKVIREPLFYDEDVHGWLDLIKTGKIRSLGNEWLFEKEQDAIMFSLRWL